MALMRTVKHGVDGVGGGKVLMVLTLLRPGSVLFNLLVSI